MVFMAILGYYKYRGVFLSMQSYNSYVPKLVLQLFCNVFNTASLHSKVAMPTNGYTYTGNFGIVHYNLYPSLH
jgi:hypothetical protein